MTDQGSDERKRSIGDQIEDINNLIIEEVN